MKLRSFSENDVRGKKVLVRVDFNVPLKNGVVGDTTRISAHEDVVFRLLRWGARVALISHLGRPKGAVVPDMSLSHVRSEAERIFGVPVRVCPECVGPEVKKAVEDQKDGEVLLLENVRFHPEEQKNDRHFAEQLAAPFEVFVMDAFSASHRADSSTSAIMDLLPSFSGPLLQREATMLSSVSGNPERPFVLILGGAKVSDKIGVVENLMDKASAILVGGGMAFTFLGAKGGAIGCSLFEKDKADFAAQMMERAKKIGVDLLLPVDAVTAVSPDATGGQQVHPADAIPVDMMGLDIGPETVRLFAERAAGAKTILWNGPMGVFENPIFAAGTKGVAEGVAKCTERGGITVIGGGDTAAAAKALGFDGKVSHVSTGGGASLEFCEGKELPGIAPLVVE